MPSRPARSEMWVQTWHPTASAVRGAARARLRGVRGAASCDERETAGLPPFRTSALLRAEARTHEAARGVPAGGRASARPRCPEAGAVTVYPPVPTEHRARRRRRARCRCWSSRASRAALQRFLARVAAGAARAARSPTRRADPALGGRCRSAGDLTARTTHPTRHTAPPRPEHQIATRAPGLEQDHLRAAEQRHLAAFGPNTVADQTWVVRPRCSATHSVRMRLPSRCRGNCSSARSS